MRKHLIYLLIPLLVACEKDANWQQQVVEHQQTITTTRHSASLSVTLDEASAAIVQSIEVAYDLKADFSTAKTVAMTANKGIWQALLTGLEENRTYFVRYSLSPDYLPQWETETFMTVNPLVPSVRTSAATEISATTAVLHGEASIYDNYEITERGFYYSLLRDNDFERKQVKCGNGEGEFSATIEALRAAATYYFVAYAVNKNGIAYGDTLQFNTLNPYE